MLYITYFYDNNTIEIKIKQCQNISFHADVFVVVNVIFFYCIMLYMDSERHELHINTWKIIRDINMNELHVFLYRFFITIFKSGLKLEYA